MFSELPAIRPWKNLVFVYEIRSSELRTWKGKKG